MTVAQAHGSETQIFGMKEQNWVRFAKLVYFSNL
jgi:hypothetical protein